METNLKENKLTQETVKDESVVEMTDVVEFDDVPEAVVNAEGEVTGKLLEKEIPSHKTIELNFGIKSKELLEFEEEAIKEKNFKELQKFKKNNSLLWARIDGIEHDKERNLNLIVAKWNDMRVVIPDNLYFMPNYEFPEDYENMNEKEKANARYRLLSYQMGAVICLMVDELTAVPNKEGKMLYGVLGNRVRAMQLLQLFYFTRKNLAPEEVINVGDVVKAKVLSVAPLFAIVECLGVETRIDNFNITNGTCSDCREVVNVGDELTVRIRKLHLPENPTNKDAQVYLTVSARVKSVEKVSEAIKKNSLYQGIITKYNIEKGLYTVTLSSGINVSCHKNNVNQYTVYRVGDRVSVLIIAITDEYATGRIVSKISTR